MMQAALVQQIQESYEGKFANFLAEWKIKRPQFTFRIETLFPRFGNIDEAIDFVAQASTLSARH